MIVCREVDSGAVHVFDEPQKNPKPFLTYAQGVTKWIGHHFLKYDGPIIANLLGYCIDPSAIIDTLVLSRTLNYSLEGGHSLEAWGDRLGHRKDLFEDFSRWSFSLRNRCIQDTLINWELYNRFKPYLDDPTYRRALDIELSTEATCLDLHNNGFYFNYEKAQEYYSILQGTIEVLLKELQEAYPPLSVLIREINPKATAKGTIHMKDFRWLESKDLTPFLVDAPFSLFVYEAFNPSSNKQVIDRLWASGWKPTQKTDGHVNAIKEGLGEKMDHFRRYGWKISEENLGTLPADAPEASRKLAQWLTLKNRVSTLEQWFKAYRPSTGRIHGTFHHIGAPSHRMAHDNPNMANVYGEFSRDGKVSLYGKEFRQLWTVPPGKRLLGCDAEGIQFRVFAHYTNDKKLINVIETGTKEAKDDIHFTNWEIAGKHICVSREVAKTFGYAWILGAGIGQVASIFGCSHGEAKLAMDRFFKAYPGYAYLREEVIPRDVRNGYFRGFDGRVVFCDSAHRMPAYYLQCGEAVIMKLACIIWQEQLRKERINYKLVNYVHDEWQTEVDNDEELCHYISVVQANSIKQAGLELNLNCAMAGSIKKPGLTWYDSH
jgi:DNA polymerase-1